MRKALIVVGTLLVLLFVAVALIPVLFRDRLVAAATAQLNRSVNATVAFDTADLTLLSSFPSLELALGGVRVTGRGAFEGVELARVGEARVALDLMSVLAGDHVRIRSVHVEDADVHVVVDEQGRTNTDIALPSDAPASTEPSTFALDLEAWSLVDVDVSYADRQGGTGVTVEDLDGTGRLSVTSDRTDVATHTTIAALTVDGLLDRVAVVADLAAVVDAASGAITLGENRLALNALPIAFRGTVSPAGEDLGLDLSFSASETSFGALFSLLPAYTREVDGLVTNGTLALQGAVKGTVKANAEDHLPGFDLTLQVADGAFHYPSLPTSVDGIQLDVAVHHPEGVADLTEVDVTRFAMAVGGSPVTGSVRLRNPMTDPDVAAKVVGQIDLGVLRRALPPSPSTYEGRANVDLDIAGRVSQFTAQAVDQVRAKGTFRLEDFRYASPGAAVPVVIDRLLLTLDPRRADLTELTMRLGESDLHASGTVDNAIAYALTDATLVGRMDVTSAFLDLDALAGGGDAAPPSAAPEAKAAPPDTSSVVVIPADLDFAVTARADRIRYGGHDATDATGTFAVKDGAVRIDALRMGLLGGTVGLSGSYAAPTDAHADVDLQVEMVDFDVGETVAAFHTLEELVPVAKGARGRFHSGFRMQARLGPDLAPDLQTVLSDGRLQTKKLTLTPAFLAQVADRLGNDAFRTLDLDDATLGFAMREGRIALSPAAVKLGGVVATLGGSTGALDRTLDLDLGMQVPLGKVKAADLLGKLGVAKGGAADVKVKVGGTYDKPTVRLDLADVAGAIEDQVTSLVKAGVDDATDRLLAEARAQGDALVAEAERQAAKLKAEAKKQADALMAEAKKQADKLAAEAKGNPLAEAAAKEAKKKLLAEAGKKVDKLEAEAGKKADSLVDVAKRERTKLLHDAETRAKAAAR